METSMQSMVDVCDTESWYLPSAEEYKFGTSKTGITISAKKTKWTS